MRTISYSKLRSELAKTMDQVCEDQAPYLVTRQGGEPVVILSLSEYESLDETAYLLSNAANAEHLRRSVAEFESGQTVSQEPPACD